MEYPFKLSEIIAGCESGAWLEGAVFVNFRGDHIIFNSMSFGSTTRMSCKTNWRFSHYLEK